VVVEINHKSSTCGAEQEGTLVNSSRSECKTNLRELLNY